VIPQAAPATTGPNIEAREASLQAAKACLRLAGYDEESIERGILALDGREESLSSLEKMLTAEDVCERLHISTSTLWRRGIPHVMLGGLRRYYSADVQQYLNCRYVRDPKAERARARKHRSPCGRQRRPAAPLPVPATG
jgi:predicted DNA-binding transcriptional regulator AlpA